MNDTKPYQLIRQAQGDVARATGHQYRDLERACENMSVEALRDLSRLIRNLQDTATSEKRKRRRGQFWG